jgi:hypothetical protein
LARAAADLGCRAARLGNLTRNAFPLTCGLESRKHRAGQE